MLQKDLNTNKEFGFVLSAQDYLLFLTGLPTIKINDIILTQKGSRALVTGLENEKVEALMLDSERPKPGDMFAKSTAGLYIPNITHLLGRAISPLGAPLDDKGSLPPGGSLLDIDKTASGIDTREIIAKQFITGITLIDTLLPIGRGQRELLFGESRSGKSSFILDTIINQKGQKTICIYTAIGRSDVDVQRFIKSINENGAFDYTVLIAATSSEAAPLIYIAPAVGFAIAENFRDKGLDVLLILDDLGNHAKYLREIGLLSGRIPGRESYPPDIFYEHSHLVERAGNFNENLGKGSITLLPVVETDIEKFTNLIPTNVMSMTDGHLLFSSSLRAHGSYPAIDPDRSVTRVGRQTQPFLHKIVADRVRSLLANFHELERYSRFGSELTPQSQLTIKRGNIVVELLRQEPLEKIDSQVQILLLGLLFSSFFDNWEIEPVRINRRKIIDILGTDNEFKRTIADMRRMNFDALVGRLKENHKIIEDGLKQ